MSRTSALLSLNALWLCQLPTKCGLPTERFLPWRQLGLTPFQLWISCLLSLPIFFFFFKQSSPSPYSSLPWRPHHCNSPVIWDTEKQVKAFGPMTCHIHQLLLGVKLCQGTGKSQSTAGCHRMLPPHSRNVWRKEQNNALKLWHIYTFSHVHLTVIRAIKTQKQSWLSWWKPVAPDSFLFNCVSGVAEEVFSVRSVAVGIECFS